MSVATVEAPAKPARTDIAVTSRIAARTSALSFADLPADIVTLARQTLLDWFAVAIAGSGEELSRILVAEAREQGGNPRATLVGHGGMTSTQQAALVNGATSHALDYDDTNFVAYGHCGAAIIPAVLALAEARDLSGSEVIAALVAGFEANGAAGSMVGQAHYDRGFHSTATIGSFGAAGACANLLGLDAEQTATAFGIAACQTAGLKSMFGTMCKPLHAGKAAQNGLIAATLAARGFTSAGDVLECEQGFAVTHSPDYRPEDAVTPAPGGFYIAHNLFKYHAACYITHAPIECALKIAGGHQVTPDQIAGIRLRVQDSAQQICNIIAPTTGLEAKFSLRQTIAFAFCGIETGRLDTFTDAQVADPAAAALRERVHIDFRADQPRASADMEVLLTDGRTFSASHDANAPATDLAEQGRRLRAKFIGLAGPVLGDARAEQLGAAVMAVDTADSVREIMCLAVPAA